MMSPQNYLAADQYLPTAMKIYLRHVNVETQSPRWQTPDDLSARKIYPAAPGEFLMWTVAGSSPRSIVRGNLILLEEANAPSTSRTGSIFIKISNGARKMYHVKLCVLRLSFTRLIKRDRP